MKLAQQETGEVKGHYLNCTANTPEELYERAEFAKELDMPIIMHDYITCLLYTSPSPRDATLSRMPSSA